MDRVIPPMSPAVEGLFMALVIFQALQEMCVLEDLIDQRDADSPDAHEVDLLKELEDDSSTAFSQSDGERDEMELDFEGDSIPGLFGDSEDEDENEDEEEEDNESDFNDENRDFLYDDDVDLFDSGDDGYEEDSEVSSNGKRAVPVSFNPLREEVERERRVFRRQQTLSMMDEIKLGKIAELRERVRNIDFDINDPTGEYNFGYGTLLENAVAYGSREIFRLLLELGPDLNDDTNALHQSMGYAYPSLLSTAVINKNWEVVKLMIREGANVNEYGFNGTSATSTAILLGNVETANFFLDRGANVNAFSKFSYPALGSAADNGDEVAALMLLERGANVNLRLPGSMSALHLAARKGHTRVARLLMKYRADCTAKVKTGETPADMAMNRGSFELAREIAACP